MAEYIEREAVVDSLNKLCDRVCQYSKRQRKVMCGACPLGDAFTVIEDDIPAADVRPVVRGKWIGYKVDDPGWLRDDGTPVFITCDQCGAFVMNNASAQWNYCPNCGCAMEGTE